MCSKYQPFKEPIYVTRPLLPDLDSVTKKLQEIWSSKWLTNNGPQHHLLEERLQKVLKAPALSLFNNGTIALLTACQSMELRGEVITTPFTFAATTHVLNWNNLTPVFCDIDVATMNIDADKIEALITRKTSAILAVHVFGVPCDVQKIEEIADKYHIKVIYDAAHAFSVEINGRGIGTYGDISMVSFHATKLYHTVEGGALVYNDPRMKLQIDLLKNFGIKNEDEVILPGINGKMNEVQAAIGLVNLDYYEEEQQKRKRLIEIYRIKLRGIAGILLQEDIAGVKSNYQYFVVRINADKFGHTRDFVYDQFKTYNVFTRKYFHPLCSAFDCYKNLASAAKQNLPIASQVADEVLSLPLYGELSESDVEKICGILIGFRG